MSRSLDDDASRRVSDAEEALSAEQEESADNERTTLRNLRQIVRNLERGVTRRRRRRFHQFVMLLIASASLLTGALWTALFWNSPSEFVRVDIVCGALLLSGAAAFMAGREQGSATLGDLEEALDSNRDSLRFLSALYHPTVKERRSLYREDVAGVIEQHRTDSRKYRRVHNTLQNLIMIGSASTTVVAALDTRNQYTWQNITIVSIGFTGTARWAAGAGYLQRESRSRW
ncbi:hypothetical protein ACFUV1_08740 [Streptomyces griseoincarnatus]